MGYVPQLDGMRGIAVLLVVAFHASPVFGWLNGWRGVTIFFVLSGYLITTLALTEEEQRGRMSFLAFYIRRTFRIFPLYYLVLLLYCILVFGLGLSPEKRPGMAIALPYYSTYLQEVALALYGGPEKIPFGQSWSLGIEEKFYLVWPLIAFGFLARARHLRPWVAGSLALFSAAIALFGSALMVAVVGPYSAILIGCLLAVVKPQRLAGRIPLTYPSLVLVVLCQTVVSWFALPGWARWLNDVVYSCAVALMLAGVVTESSRARVVLSWRPLAFVGKVSYGIYLIHVLCLHAARKVVSDPYLVLLLTSALSIAAAWLLYLTVEKPLMVQGRRLSARVLERPQPALEVRAA